MIIGAIFLYFGRIISDTKVEKYDRLGTYIEGLLFSSVYVFIPFLISYCARDIIEIPEIIVIGIQLFILLIMSYCVILQNLIKYEIDEKYEKSYFVKVFGNKNSIFLFALLTIFTTLNTLEGDDIFLLGLSLVFTLVILTQIALLFGFAVAHYPCTKFYLENEKIIEGKALKFGEFIHILKGNKKIFINKDKIIYFEESKFKRTRNN